MHLRTLRLLITLAVLGVIFIYLASSQISSNLPVKAPDEGQPGGPVTGLTKRQLDKFYKAKEAFNKTFTVADGLGPLYNEQSCAACHASNEPPGQMLDAVLFAKRKSKSAPPSSGATALSPATAGTPATSNSADGPGKLPAATAPSQAIPPFDKIQSTDLDYMLAEGGPYLIRKSITEQFSGEQTKIPADCKVQSIKEPPKGAEFTSVRRPASLAGIGLLEAITDQAIQYQAGVQKQRNGAVSGKIASSRNQISGWPAVGRFGHRGQDQTVYQVCSRELATHLGVTSPLNSLPSAPPNWIPECLKQFLPQDPNDGGKLVQQITYYVSLLAPPSRGQITDEVERGERIFNKVGCADCHVSEVMSGEKVFLIDPDSPPLRIQAFPPDTYSVQEEPLTLEIKALESKPVRAYTDLLLHDMGPRLADGVAQGNATGSEWRTAPLWGVGKKAAYLHDGRANTLERAIELHDGEAAESAKKFAALSPDVRAAVIAFLKSL